MQNKRIIKE